MYLKCSVATYKYSISTEYLHHLRVLLDSCFRNFVVLIFTFKYSLFGINFCMWYEIDVQIHFYFHLTQHHLLKTTFPAFFL